MLFGVAGLLLAFINMVNHKYYYDMMIIISDLLVVIPVFASLVDINKLLAGGSSHVVSAYPGLTTVYFIMIMAVAVMNIITLVLVRRELYFQ